MTVFEPNQNATELLLGTAGALVTTPLGRVLDIGIVGFGDNAKGI